MEVPSTATRVRIDRQDRVVLPRWLLQELGADPGGVAVRRTAEVLVAIGEERRWR